MEFARREDNSYLKKITTKNFLQEKYPLDLTLYLDPPDERVSIDEIKEMALERVKFLRVLETASAKICKGRSFKEIVIEEMQKQNLKYFMPLVNGYTDVECRRRDHLSHFILRICYCRSEEYKKWFVARETDFFRIKFYNIDRKEDLTLFMKKNNLNYIPIPEEEKVALSVELINSSMRYINLDVLNVYKVHFTEVLDLIRKRRVFLKGGYAYVLQSDIYSLLVSVFRKNLIEELNHFAKNLPHYESDQRINMIVRNLHTCYTGKDYSSSTNKKGISRHSLDALSFKSFPLCMKAMHETFKTTHHLRHNARLQYGLFLKGIGLSMEESLQFWKEGFTQKSDINSDIFEKRYAYSIRHNYGNEGKRANYTPHNCVKIINTSVGPGDNHGCPFKHYDINFLRKMISSYKISSADVSNIIDYAGKGHYQLACTKFFEATHVVSNWNGINHPNQYFEDSQSLLKDSESQVMKESSLSEAVNASGSEWDEDFSLNDITTIMNNIEGNNAAT